MNRFIASVAVVLCLLVQAPLDAQQRPSDSRGASSRGASPNRSTQVKRTVRTASPAAPASRASRETSRRPATSGRGVTQASHQMAAGEVIYEDAGYEDAGYGDAGYGDGGYVDEGYVSDGGCQSCDGGGCSSCSSGSGSGGGFCNTCSAPGQFCICFPSHGWVNAEYLNWYPSGMQTPPLVTTSNPSTTSQANAGVRGLPTTSVLYGGNDILDGSWSGFRIRFGWWLAALPGWGIEGEYTGFGERTESFFQQSSGNPILARPFFNTLTGMEDSELVAYPGVIGGSVAVDATSRFVGAAVRFRRQLCCNEGCGYSALCCQTVPTASRLDATVGYRFWELNESLKMQERLNSQLVPSNPGSFVITDRFDTRNLFNGGEVGVLWQGRRGWWSLDMLMRLGIGNNNQTVTISGNTVTTVNGLSTDRTGGLLAQRTNIGTYERNQFTMVPELGATVGYQITRRLRATAGYSLIYMGNVVRPGDQVDLNVNPNLLPPENVPFSGALRPQFHFVETDYCIQGLNFGGEFRW